MDQLEINDQAMVGMDGRDQPIYEPVYAFGHYGPSEAVDYLRIFTSKQQEPLEISAAHLLYLAGVEHPVRADTIQKGDVLVQVAAEAPTTTLARVTKVEKTTDRMGAYMPLTKSGTIVVNGLQASCYVSIREQAPKVVAQYGWSEDGLLHAWLAPYRLVCGGAPGLCSDDYNEEGIAGWLVLGRYLAVMANEWGPIPQAVGMLLVGLFMVFFLVLEWFLWSAGSILSWFGLVFFAVGAWEGSNNERKEGKKKKVD